MFLFGISKLDITMLTGVCLFVFIYFIIPVPYLSLYETNLLQEQEMFKRAKFEVQMFGWMSWSHEHLNLECVY